MTVEVTTLSEILKMNFKDDRITEYSPMYVPLTNNYISRVYDCEADSVKFKQAQRMFLMRIKDTVEDLKDLDPNNIDDFKRVVDIITDINHTCVKYGHIMQKAGCSNMLFEVKRKDDKSNPTISTEPK